MPWWGHALSSQAASWSPDHLFSEPVCTFYRAGPPFRMDKPFHFETGFQKRLKKTQPLAASLLQMKLILTAPAFLVTKIIADKIFSARSTWLSSQAHFPLFPCISLHLHHILLLFNDSSEKKRNQMHFKEDIWHLSKSKNWGKVYSYSNHSNKVIISIHIEQVLYDQNLKSYFPKIS